MLGQVIGIIPHSQFCPILSPYIDFSKKIVLMSKLPKKTGKKPSYIDTKIKGDKIGQN